MTYNPGNYEAKPAAHPSGCDCVECEDDSLPPLVEAEPLLPSDPQALLKIAHAVRAEDQQKIEQLKLEIGRQKETIQKIIAVTEAWIELYGGYDSQEVGGMAHAVCGICGELMRFNDALDSDPNHAEDCLQQTTVRFLDKIKEEVE